MKRIYILLISCLFLFPISKVAGQSKDTVSEKVISRPVYHASKTKVNNLIHTALHVSFNWEKSQLEGTATITLTPHFYPTDSLILDAKAMVIKSVKMKGKPLNYTYNDGKHLRIGLGKTYKRGEVYKVTIQYVSRPEKIEGGGSSAITEAKGLYFINPQRKDPYEMPQIWTQGETEASSVWFPTIEATNQKMSQEIWMTVDDKYKTLSNGKLISSKENGDGTRTDYWKRDLKAAPYLTMMAVGNFAIVKDSYTKKDGTVIPVNYYVEPEWKEDARAIFGRTPEMIKFFSNLLGIEYQWPKYNQIVVREYVSGAMENTGATVLGDFLYQTKREIIDGNNDKVISHELFHHWFGDLVTAESWANITLNESFADYGQYLWDTYKYGRDFADLKAEKEGGQYLTVSKTRGTHDLVYYDYKNVMDVFDVVSYNKGGRILHMLRTYVGDSAFFKGLHLYLTRHMFGTAEVANFRMAMEQVTGEDLNWFFNEWYFAAYHPILKITDAVENGKVSITIKQKQDLDKAPLYKLPMNVAIYTDKGKTLHPIVIDKNINHYTFNVDGEVKNIIVDADRATLGVFNYEKPEEWYIYQYYHGPLFKDREEAINKGANVNNKESLQMLIDALNDKFWYIRKLAITKLKSVPKKNQKEVYKKLMDMAKKDASSHVRSAANNVLAKYYFEDHKEEVHNLLINTIKNDSSYLSMSTALKGLANTGRSEDLAEAIDFAHSLESQRSSKLKAAIMNIYLKHGDSSNLDFMALTLAKGQVKGYDALGALFSFTGLLRKQDLSTQEKYLPLFQRLSEKGGAYIGKVFPIAVRQLLFSAKSNLKTLKAKKKEGNPELTQKIKAGETFIEALKAL